MNRISRVAAAFAGISVFLLLTSSCDSDDDSPDSSGGAQSGGAAQGDDGDWGGGGSVPDVPREDIGDVVFAEEEVQSFHLTVSDEEYEKLIDFSTLLVDPWNVNTDRYVEASLQYGNTELGSIGLRIKGNYSIWGCVDFVTKQRIERVESFFGDIDVCQRFSLKLDFNRYNEDARLDGLKKINLQAMSADPSKLRDRLAYSLYRDMDIIAPRAVHARVYINGEYHGLFAAVEQVDGRFTANRFPDSGDGNVYKQIWPSEDATASKTEEALRTNDDPGSIDVSHFLAFRDAVASANDGDFETKLAPFVDFDSLARFIVVDRAINDFDSIMAFYFGPTWGPFNQNYYWYHGDDDRFQIIPWDFDKALWQPEPNFWSDNRPNGQNVVPDWNVRTNSCDGYVSSFDSTRVTDGVTYNDPYGLRQIDCDPFLRMLRGVIFDRQKAIAEAFIAGPFSEASVAAKVEAWRSQIAEAVEEDPLVDSAKWESAVNDLLTELPKFHANLSLMMDGLIDE